MRLWYRGWQWASQVGFTCYFGLRIFQRENVPKEGPVLLVSNHQSFLDPVLCGIGLPRELDYIARDSLFRNRLFARYIRSLNAFPIQRGQADIAAIRTVVNRLQQGRAMVLFPEGTRTRDGRISPLKSGFELISRRSGATTVPVVIDGAFETWPRTKKIFSMGQIKVIFGEPVTPEQIKTMNRQDFVNLINQRMYRMHNEIRCRYGKTPFNYDD
ncbi:MAG: 1-acyl-sn-glycerol-3-phosphate acyltransferase [Planctomycetes bacterium]|nr:1-acyl-sn-glycerol-3-phosphate acyltransferase [Planctomycetota bacterium]